MKILDAASVKGSFFVVGKALDAQPQIVRDLVADGQLVGNHSYHHDDWRWLDPRYPELERTQDAFAREIGTCPVWFRPPHGQHTPMMARVVHQHRMHIALWDVSVGDWATEDADLVAQKVLERVRGGSIIDLHDGLDGKPWVDRSVVVRGAAEDPRRTAGEAPAAGAPRRARRRPRVPAVHQANLSEAFASRVSRRAAKRGPSGPAATPPGAESLSEASGPGTANIADHRGRLALAVFTLVWVVVLALYLRHRIVLSSDSVNNHVHVWYIARDLWHHGRLPWRFPQLAHGDAYAYPYGFVNWTTAALVWPLFGDWVVTLWTALGAVGCIVATYAAFPELRRGWWAAAVLANPAILEALLFGQQSFAWGAMLLGIAAWRRNRPLRASARRSRSGVPRADRICRSPCSSSRRGSPFEHGAGRRSCAGTRCRS